MPACRNQVFLHIIHVVQMVGSCKLFNAPTLFFCKLREVLSGNITKHQTNLL